MGAAGQDWYRTFFGDTWNLRVALSIPEEQTREEVDFIINTLKLEEGARVLDLACGHGRHSLELTRRGFSVVGVDLSEEALRIARKNAEQAGVTVDYHLTDMREIGFSEEFDAVINMFTAFGYLEGEEEDQKVLDRIAAALRPGGRFLIDTINFLWLIRNFHPDRWHDYDDGTVLLESRRYDLLTGRDEVTWRFLFPDGSTEELHWSLRLYTLVELADMLDHAGLSLEQTFGNADGAEYGMDTRRMIVVARK